MQYLIFCVCTQEFLSDINILHTLPGNINVFITLCDEWCRLDPVYPDMSVWVCGSCLSSASSYIERKEELTRNPVDS